MTGKQPKRKPRPGVDSHGRAPLHYAAVTGDLATVRRLIAEGAHPDLADDNGMTPLHFAAQESRVEVALALLDAGASVDPVDAHGNTPLSKAVFNSRGHGALIAALRERGANPTRQNHHGVSPLSLARTIANFDVAQFFKDLPSG